LSGFSGILIDAIEVIEEAISGPTEFEKVRSFPIIKKYFLDRASAWLAESGARPTLACLLFSRLLAAPNKDAAVGTTQPSPIIPWYNLVASAPASKLTVSLFGTA
jgi:hypothetical protein